MRLEEKSSLALVDFLCQNRSGRKESAPLLRVHAADAQRTLCSSHSNCLERRTAEGNTALHYSVLHHKPESLKLLLKAKAALQTGTVSALSLFWRCGIVAADDFVTLPTANSAGETALDAARRLQHTQCIELVSFTKFRFQQRVANNTFITAHSGAAGNHQVPALRFALVRCLRAFRCPIDGGNSSCWFLTLPTVFQLELAQSGKFNSQIHVEFTWETQSQEFYDSEDDLDERVSPSLQHRRPSSCSRTNVPPALDFPR